MLELTVWLMVTLNTPEGNYLIVDEKEPMEQCISDSAEWTRYAMKANRGEWVLKSTCQVERSEAQGASLRQKHKKQG